jgi:hypothetical protein
VRVGELFSDSSRQAVLAYAVSVVYCTHISCENDNVINIVSGTMHIKSDDVQTVPDDF